MLKHTFNRFGIEVPDGDINLISIDLGDGEYCVWECYFDCGVPIHRELKISDDEKKHRLMSMYFEVGSSRVVGDLAIRVSGDEVNRHLPLYENFKKPPTSIEARQNYRKRTDTLPHIEVMRRFFQTIVKEVFAKNHARLSRYDYTLIFVGRPASRIWSDCEIEYASLLTQDLKIGNYDGKIDVVVYSEAEAALASEIKRENAVDDNATLIIDGGSSTYDAVLIKDRVIIDQLSWQIGASRIENNLYDLFLAGALGDEENIKQKVDLRRGLRDQASFILSGVTTEEGRLIIDLREHKENYFGADGNDKKPQVFEMELNGEKKTLLVTEDVMRTATHEMAVRVYDNGETGDMDFDSFAHAVDAFMQEVYKFFSGYAISPDSVVLTGGSTAMPFVREAAEKIFGKEKVKRAQQPNYSVVEGLAYMLGAEVETYRETAKVLEIIKEEVFNCGWGIRQIMLNRYAEIIWQRNFVKKLKTWKDSKQDLSLNDWWMDCDFQVPIDEFRQGLTNYLKGEDGLESSIRVSLKNSFEELLGQGNAPFEIILDMEKHLREACENMEGFSPSRPELGELIGGWRALLQNFLANDWDGDRPLELIWRQHVHKYVHARRLKVKEMLTEMVRGRCEEASSVFCDALVASLDSLVPDYIEKMKPYLVKRD